MVAEDEEERPAPKQVVRIVALLAAAFSTSRGNRETAVIARAKKYEKYIEVSSVRSLRTDFCD